MRAINKTEKWFDICSSRMYQNSARKKACGIEDSGHPGATRVGHYLCRNNWPYTIKELFNGNNLNLGINLTVQWPGVRASMVCRIAYAR